MYFWRALAAVPEHFAALCDAFPCNLHTHSHSDLELQRSERRVETMLDYIGRLERVPQENCSLATGKLSRKTTIWVFFLHVWNFVSYGGNLLLIKWRKRIAFLLGRSFGRQWKNRKSGFPRIRWNFWLRDAVIRKLEEETRWVQFDWFSCNSTIKGEYFNVD